MTRNISLLAVTALLALLACVAPRASAQTFDKTHSTALILAGGGNDLLNSLTIQLTGNAGNGLTWNLNPVNANGVFVNDGTGAISFSTTLPGSLTLNNETIGGTTSIGGSTSINTSGAITTTSTISGGAVTFSSETVNGNTTLDALPNTGGAINIGNSTPTLGDTSTTTINGVLNVTGPTNFSGPVNIPAGGLNLGLANDKFYIGSALGTATPQTISQDVTITNTGVATVNGATGNFKVTGNDTINGNLDVKGNFNIGGAASVDTLNGNVDFTGPTINFKYAPTFPAGSVADSSITLTNDNVLIGNSSNQSVAHTISQDVTITNTGVATVNGATGNFKVTGNDTINGNLDVKGNFNIGGAASVDTLNGNVDFTGPTINFKYAPTFPAGSFADSSITLTNDNVLIGNSSNQAVAHTISQDVTITNTGVATVNGATGNFKVTGNDTINGNLDVKGNFNIGGAASVDTLNGNVDFTGPTINFKYAPTFPAGSFADSSITLTNDNVLIGNSSNQSVAHTISQDVTITNTGVATVNGATGNFKVTGNDTINGNLDVKGNFNIGGAASVDTLNGNVDFTGPTINFKYAPTFPAGSFADSSITLTNDNVLIGNSSNQSVAHTISQDVTITNTGVATVNGATGNFKVTGNDTINGNLDVKGNFNIGGAASVDTLNGNVDFTGPTINFKYAPTFPAGSFADSSITLTNDNVLIGNSSNQSVAHTISQDVTITNTGVATVNGASGTKFTVSGYEDVTGGQNVTGPDTLSTLSTSGLATLNKATVTNNLLVSGGANVVGNDTTGGNAFITGYQTLTGGQQVGGNDTVIGTLYSKGNANIDATPSTGGAVNIGNNTAGLGDSSSTTINGNVSLTGAVTFSGPVTIPSGGLNLGLTNDKFYIGNSNGVATAQTISQDVTITNTGAATVNSASGTKFTVSGYEDVTGGQNVTGPDTLSTLSTSGLATLNKATVTNNLLVSGGAKVVGNDTTGGNAFITGYQTITGGQQIGGNDTVIGTLYSNGNANIDASPSTSGAVNIGNSTSTTTFNGTLNLSGATITLPNNSVTNAQLQNSTIAVGSTGSTLSVTGSPISLGGTAGNVEINLAHANTWSGTQTFGATALTASSPAAFGSNPTADYAIGTSNTYFKISTSIAAGDTLSGIANGADGRVIILLNNGSANSIILVNEDGNDATPANRIHLAGGGTSAGAGTGGGPTLILAPDGFVTLIYDATISRWRVLSSK